MKDIDNYKNFITTKIFDRNELEINDFFDNIYDLILAEATEKLSPMFLNLVCGISTTDSILEDESKKINTEIVEFIKKIPSSSYTMNESFFWVYNLFLHDFINNEKYFNLYLEEWLNSDKDLEKFLKIIIVNFLKDIYYGTLNEFVTDNDDFDILNTEIDNILKLYNETNSSKVTFYNFPKDFEMRYYCLGINYEVFLNRYFHILFKLLSSTVAISYITILKKKRFNTIDILHCNLKVKGLELNSKISIKSYNWIAKKDIKVLYKLLNDKDLIFSGTNESNFKKAFNNREVDKSYEKIKFNILSDSEVLYLITNLMEYNLISRESSFSWNRFYKLFDIKSTSLKNSKKELDSKLSKPKKDIIIDIITSLK